MQVACRTSHVAQTSLSLFERRATCDEVKKTSLRQIARRKSREYRLFYRALLQKRRMFSGSLRIVSLRLSLRQVARRKSLSFAKEHYKRDLYFACLWQVARRTSHVAQTSLSLFERLATCDEVKETSLRQIADRTSQVARRGLFDEPQRSF